MIRISNRDARWVFLHRHALLQPPQGEAHGGELLNLIVQLGFVQLDSINTVARAHDLILFSRRPRYRPRNLKTLYEKHGALFEHWTHDAAVIPMQFYPYWDLRRKRDAEKLRKRWRSQRRAGFEKQFQKVLDQIRLEGPCCSADVGKGEARGSGGWWDWHPSKTALEYLWRSGALTVVGRDGFQKRYDLTERVIERSLLDPQNTPDYAATVNWCCDQALARLGFATHGELAAFWAHLTPQETRDWCARKCAEGALEMIEITCADGGVKNVFAKPDLLEDAAFEQKPTCRLRLLSPFDPALRDRKRAKQLFGFDYRIEVFVPEAQRTFGYYVFPILQGDRIIARVDMKAFRDQDVLYVKALWPEGKMKWGKQRQQAFEAELHRVKKLAGVSHVSFQNGWLQPSAQHQF
ncbi:MAG: crosslink repair DNA glycosylase YcaQ family protein [Pseudomonadota bacterium]